MSIQTIFYSKIDERVFHPHSFFQSMQHILLWLHLNPIKSTMSHTKTYPKLTLHDHPIWLPVIVTLGLDQHEYQSESCTNQRGFSALVLPQKLVSKVSCVWIKPLTSMTFELPKILLGKVRTQSKIAVYSPSTSSGLVMYLQTKRLSSRGTWLGCKRLRLSQFKATLFGLDITKMPYSVK